MAFIIITAFIAFAIAAVSETFSIIGLASIFPSIFWSVVAMGVVLGAGKLVSASIIYRYWKSASKLLTIPLFLITIVLTGITMSGHFGYLSSGYLQDSIGVKQVESEIALIDSEKTRKIERKNAIDKQIASLPDNYSSSRIRLSKQFEPEQKVLSARINELDLKIIDLKSKQITAESHTGPITYIAKAVGLSTDNSVKWLILIIVGVFDPLAIFLTVSISMMIQKRNEDLKVVTKESYFSDPVKNILEQTDNKISVPQEVVASPTAEEIVPVKEVQVISKKKRTQKEKPLPKEPKWFEPRHLSSPTPPVEPAPFNLNVKS